MAKGERCHCCWLWVVVVVVVVVLSCHLVDAVVVIVVVHVIVVSGAVDFDCFLVVFLLLMFVCGCFCGCLPPIVPQDCGCGTCFQVGFAPPADWCAWPWHEVGWPMRSAITLSSLPWVHCLSVMSCLKCLPAMCAVPVCVYFQGHHQAIGQWPCD